MVSNIADSVCMRPKGKARKQSVGHDYSVLTVAFVLSCIIRYTCISLRDYNWYSGPAELGSVNVDCTSH